MACPVKSPAAQPVLPFEQLVFLHCSRCRHTLHGQENSVTLLRYWIRREYTGYAVKYWSSLQLCSVDGAPITRAGDIKMLTSACISRQSTVLFIKDCTVHV